MRIIVSADIDPTAILREWLDSEGLIAHTLRPPAIREMRVGLERAYRETDDLAAIIMDCVNTLDDMNDGEGVEAAVEVYPADGMGFTLENIPDFATVSHIRRMLKEHDQ